MSGLIVNGSKENIIGIFTHINTAFLDFSLKLPPPQKKSERKIFETRARMLELES